VGSGDSVDRSGLEESLMDQLTRTLRELRRAAAPMGAGSGIEGRDAHGMGLM
jgi:hypothetical protein